MSRTRSQTGNIAVKREEDSKSTLSVDHTAMTTRNQITKKKIPIISNRRLPAQQVMVEEDIDIKLLLKPTPNFSKKRKGSHKNK
jgi:L-2-hydroxyglutarate oxidase LhgO